LIETPDPYKNRPALVKKKEAIEKIDSFLLNKIKLEELDKHLRTIFSGYLLRARFPTPGLVIYRGIKYESKPRSFDDLTYPPKEKAKINRANFESEQMFYGTTEKKAVFYELYAKPGDTLVISTWYSTLHLALSNVGFTEQNLKSLGANDTAPLIVPGIDIHDDLENQFIHEYLSKTFSQSIQDPNLYKLTASIAKRFLDDTELVKADNSYFTFDGVIYPTIRFNANADSIALKPMVIDDHKIEFERAEFVEVLDYVNNKYQYKIIDMADKIDVNGILLWNELSKTWTVNDEDQDLFFVDGMAYTSEGEIVAEDKS
jgi:hypothetical protein